MMTPLFTEDGQLRDLERRFFWNVPEDIWCWNQGGWIASRP